MDSSSTARFLRGPRTRLALPLLLLFILLAITGTATAAEIFDEEVYLLQEGEVVQDDLVVFAREATIDGTVEGDLVAFGQTVIVNGIVTGDVNAAGAEVFINGVVQDDVRVAGAAIQIDGRVGDDVFMAGGGFIPGFGAIPITMGDRTIISGLGTGPEATIGGDAYIAGGTATLEGIFRNDLFAAAASLRFDAEVEGNAVLESESLTFGENAFVAGDLRYSAPTQSGTPEAGGVITETEPETQERAAPDRRQRSPVVGFGWWLMRTILVIGGIVLVGLVLLALARSSLTRPVDAIEEKPVIAGVYGILIAAVAIPLSAALVFLASLFFGWFWGGVASFTFLFGLILMAWVLSPAVTGLWLGRKIFSWLNIRARDIYALLVGVSIIVLVGRMLGAIPCAGVLAYMVVYLLSFALAAGGVLLTRGAAQSLVDADTTAL